ncbi:MAG: sugar phosphate isomerase/epimerase [Oscillospiraceae bacterium]|nr:sugar phosphate isomerase/epimerase [Oscillospiraceae bacterium]
MKLGVNTYAWLWNETLSDSVKIIGENGFKGLEFLVSPPHFYLQDYRPGMYRDIRKMMDDYGMESLSVNIPGLDINVASPFPEMRKMTLDLYKRLTDVALELETQILLVLPGKRHPLLPPDFDLIQSYAVDTIGKVIEHTKDTNLTIGLETSPALFIDKVHQLKHLRDQFNNERVKIVYDAANVFMQEDPAEALKLVKDDLCLLHLSDTKKTKWEHAPLGTGDIDAVSFIKAAQEIGFDGYLSLEIINDQGIQGVLDSIAYLEERGISLPK